MPRPGARRCGARPPHPTNRTTSVRALPIVKIEMGTGRRAGDVYSTPQGQLNTPVHWARWTVRQQLTLRTSGAIIRHGAIIRSLLVKRKQEYHEACPPNVLTAVCRSGASQVGHCLHLSVERFGYGCTFWCVYVSSCFSLVLGTVQAWHYGAITWTASRA